MVLGFSINHRTCFELVLMPSEVGARRVTVGQAAFGAMSMLKGNTVEYASRHDAHWGRSHDPRTRDARHGARAHGDMHRESTAPAQYSVARYGPPR